MSRHRNVRTMNYEDEYDGYDDVYGHSVEDDSYGLSPGTAQMYLYDRDNDRSLSSYMTQEEDIPEEPDAESTSQESALQQSTEFTRPILSDIDTARLNSCLEEMRNILGESVPEHIMVDAVIRNNFEHDRALNDVLTQQEAPKPQRQPRTRRSRDSESDSGDGSDLVESGPEAARRGSGPGGLSDLAKSHGSPMSGSPASGLTLSELAKFQMSESPVRIPALSTLGRKMSGSSLADLASKQSKQPSLADLATIQSDSVNIASVKSLSQSPKMSHSPSREGIKLSELAKSTTSPKEPLSDIKSSIGNISLVKSGIPSSGNPKMQQFSLSALAEMNTQAKVRPATVSLSEMAKQSSSPLPSLAAKENSKPKQTDKGLPARGTGGLSLAALAQEHASSNPVSHGNISATLPPGLSPQINTAGAKPKVQPPPGFKPLGMKTSDASTSPLSGSPTQKSVGPPPGFKPKVPVDLSQLAALHDKKRITNRGRTHRDSSGDTVTSKGLVCQHVPSTKASVFGQALCMSGKTNCSSESDRSVMYPAFSYQKQTVGSPVIDDGPISELKSFDFSTPSPDDIVKTRQKAAFTRDGKMGSRGSTDNDPTNAPPPVITTTKVIDTPAPEAVTPVQGSVARMTFSSSKTVSSGFTPEKNPTENPLLDDIEALSVKRDLLGFLDDPKDKKDVPKEETTLELQAESSDMLTPKKEGNSRSASPAPTPKVPGKKHDSAEAKNEYDKRKQDGKDYINLVVIGHVDAGKSTLMGHVLYQLGFVNKRTMHKYETESKKLGKASFAYAWVLDETEEERARGVTMDVAQTRFETDSKIVTLLDAPGHKDFIPNMITGAAQADVAILVINAARGEFETGFDAGGQTREHAMLVRSLGVSQLVVAVNKLDMVDWSETRYKEIQNKIGHFLKQAGFKDSDVTFVPCSGLVGENLTKPPTDPKLSWFKGTSLMSSIDKFKPPVRQVDKPLRMCVADVFKGMGSGVWVSGTLQAGSVSPGEKVLVMPQGVPANVKSITIDEAPVKYAFAGDNAVVVMTGIDINNIGIGSIVCDPSEPVRTSNRIQARVVIFNIDVPITKGFPVVFHYQSLSEPASIKRLVSQLHKSTGEVIRSKPRCLVKNSSAVIELEINRPVCIELYKDYKDLGRFMLRYGGSTIAAGLVTEIKDTKPPKTE